LVRPVCFQHACCSPTGTAQCAPWHSGSCRFKQHARKRLLSPTPPLDRCAGCRSPWAGLSGGERLSSRAAAHQVGRGCSLPQMQHLLQLQLQQQACYAAVAGVSSSWAWQISYTGAACTLPATLAGWLTAWLTAPGSVCCLIPWLDAGRRTKRGRSAMLCALPAGAQLWRLLRLPPSQLSSRHSRW